MLGLPRAQAGYKLKQLEIESCKNGEISFGSTAEITGMVHPEFRNQGYGKGLLENSIFELRKQGAKKIFLQVVTENENALGLYLNTGFIIDSCMEYYQI